MIKKFLIGSIAASLIFVIPVEAKPLSYDWGYEDAEYLLKVGEWFGGDKYDQAYNMMVCLNKVWETRQSIPETALDISEKLRKIEYSQTSLDALEMIHEGYDPTGGDLDYELY